MNIDPAVDQYIADIGSPQARTALTQLREIIRDVLPDAEERISYRIPSYYQNGYVAGFAAFKGHCSFFPGSTVEEFLDRLGDFKTSKGTIQFKPDRPIPEDLVRLILVARVHRLAMP